MKQAIYNALGATLAGGLLFVCRTNKKQAMSNDNKRENGGRREMRGEKRGEKRGGRGQERIRYGTTYYLLLGAIEADRGQGRRACRARGPHPASTIHHRSAHIPAHGIQGLVHALYFASTLGKVSPANIQVEAVTEPMHRSLDDNLYCDKLRHAKKSRIATK